MNTKTGEQFLHKRDVSLQASQEVESVVDYLKSDGEKIPNDPAQRLEAYLGFLARDDYVNDGLLTGDPESMNRQIAALVIKPDDIPESYFDLQRRVAREQGHGDIEITDQIREQLTSTIQEDQVKSLEAWGGYLTDETNQNTYPNWFKRYAFEGMLKLGAFDKQKHTFNKRSRGTTAPFADLNAEAVAYVYDAIDSHALNGVETDDEKLTNAVQSANFAKLYAHALMEVTPASAERREVTEGSWKKYSQIENEYEPDYDMLDGEATDKTVVGDTVAMELAESLQGYGTGWCTAGTRTAAHQLSWGDFYVYYSHDEKGDDTIPRVAIRMESEQVAEVRGIEDGQNLESVMTDITMEKLGSLPGGDVYLKKVEDMKMLTEIDSRVRVGGELTAEDILRLRYGNIQGFGYDDDPRIDQLLSGRTEDEDFNVLLANFDHAELADLIVSAGHDKAIVRRLKDFNPDALDRNALAGRLVDGRQFNLLFDHWQEFNFSKTDRSDLIDKMLATGEVRYVIGSIETFATDEFDKAALFSKLIEAGKAAVVVQYLSAFNATTEQQTMLAEKLISEGEDAAVLQNLKNFEPGIVDQHGLASRLLNYIGKPDVPAVGTDGGRSRPPHRRGAGRGFIDYMENFEPGIVDYTVVADKLILEHSEANVGPFLVTIERSQPRAYYLEMTQKLADAGSEVAARRLDEYRWSTRQLDEEDELADWERELLDPGSRS